MNEVANAAPTSGMWVKVERGEPLNALEEAGAFVLVDVTVREGIKTEYGPRDVADLRVQTTKEGETRLFSTFAAGIVGQSSRSQDGDLPAVVKIRPADTPKGSTKILELVEHVTPGSALHDLAGAMATPIEPVKRSQSTEIPY